MKPIVINNFQRGIAQSAAFGFQEIRGLNITDKPGWIFPNKRLTEEDAGTFPALPLSMIIGGNNPATDDVWAHTFTNQKVFVRTGQDTWAEKTGHASSNIYNLLHYKGFVGVIFSATIGWYDTSDNAWDLDWSAASITAGGLKPTCHAQDDKIYIGAGRYIDSIEEVSGQDFNPNTGSTYEVVKAAVDLPEGESVKEILEVGNYLYLVCDYKIYPWDKSSVSFNNPINFNKYIQRAIVYNNLIYVQAGFQGEWYRTNGSTVQKFSKVPRTLFSTDIVQLNTSRLTVHNDLIYFGLYSASTIAPQAVYSLNPENGSINIEHRISTGEYGQTNGITIGQVLSLNYDSDGILVSWEDNGDYGVDRLEATKYQSNEAYFITQFMSVGTTAKNASFPRPEIKLVKPLSTNDSVKVEYRTAHNGSWTTHYTNSTAGFQAGMMPAITAKKDLQLKVTLNNTAELEEIILA